MEKNDAGGGLLVRHPQNPGWLLQPLPGRNTVSASSDICGSYDIDSIH